MLAALLEVTGLRRRRSRLDPELSVLGVSTGQKPLRRHHFQRRVPTMFSSIIRDRFGALKHLGLTHPNLRTNAGLDWQAGVMADYTTDAKTAAATSVTATSLTDTSKSWTTNQWVGHVVARLKIGGTSGCQWGVILSNTATVLTIDKWYDPANPGGAAATTGGGDPYSILPGGTPAWWMAVSTDTGAPAATDTTLTSEIVTSDFARCLPTSFSHTAATSTYSVAKTYTATTTVTINKTALFNAQNGGQMAFESAEPNPPTVVSGDTLAQTATITYT